MPRKKSPVRELVALFIMGGLLVFSSPSALLAQISLYPSPQRQNFWYLNQGFYTTDGRNIFYFPNGYPRSIHRHSIYSGNGPDFRWSTRYRWWYHRHCVIQPVYQLKFQGPYWTKAIYRPSRGIFRRSFWRCAWIPYYVTPMPNLQNLGAASSDAPLGQLQTPYIHAVPKR